MLFKEIVGFCQSVLNNMMVFSKNVFSVLTEEITICDYNISVFTVMFSTGIGILLIFSIIRFVVGLG